MNQVIGFMFRRVLAEGFFELLGPILIFGFYIIAALAKGWRKNQQRETEEKPDSDPNKTVSELPSYKKLREQIRQRQVGTTTSPVKSQSYQKPVPSVPVTQAPQCPQTPRAHPVHPVRSERTDRPLSQGNRDHRNIHQKAAVINAQATELIAKPKTPKRSIIKDVKPKHSDDLFMTLIRQPQNLRTAIILKEILDKPLALRE